MQNRHTFVAQVPVMVGVFASFLAAFLLFFIQPLWGRHLVMAFGGSATVWNVLLFAFQALLFCGYFVVFVSQFLKFKWVPVVLLAAAAAMQVCQPVMPLTGALTPDPKTLLLAFGQLVFPVLLLSVATPLIQQALTQTETENRYNLYSFSNAGSFAALLVTPLVLLPFFPLAPLLMAWRIGVLVFLMVLVGVLVLGPKATQTNHPQLWHNRVPVWFVWPFLSTGALHAYSQYLTSELANLPFIWVLPLGAFLLSYVVAFTGKLNTKILTVLAFVMLAFAAIAATFGHEKSWLVFACHFVAFAAACFYAHGKLYATHPTRAAMPLFYVLIAFAGMVAGLLSAQVFPHVLPDTYEYPAFYAALGVLFFAGLKAKKWWHWGLGAGVLCGFVGLWYVAFQTPNLLAHWRNFYGVMKVVKEGDLHVYYNNGTAHEFEDFVNDTDKPEPYLKNIIANPVYAGKAVAVIGMGPGNTACYTAPNQMVDFYEINPLMPQMANDETLFTFRKNCARNGVVTIGDGRLAFPRKDAPRYSVIVNTAHNGFTLPLHLVTKEAFEHYKQNLTPNGVLLMIVPARYFSHHNALLKTAKAAGFEAEYVPNSVFSHQSSYPYSWYAFYQTPETRQLIENAFMGVWRPARLQPGRCPVLTDAQHSFLQLAGFVGETCQ